MLARVVRQMEEIQGIRTGKEEVKLSVSVNDMILPTENPNKSTKAPLNLINELSKTARYKINTQKSVVFLHRQQAM